MGSIVYISMLYEDRVGKQTPLSRLAKTQTQLSNVQRCIDPFTTIRESLSEVCFWEAGQVCNSVVHIIINLVFCLEREQLGLVYRVAFDSEQFVYPFDDHDEAVRLAHVLLVHDEPCFLRQATVEAFVVVVDGEDPASGQQAI